MIKILVTAAAIDSKTCNLYERFSSPSPEKVL